MTRIARRRELGDVSRSPVVRLASSGALLMGLLVLVLSVVTSVVAARDKQVAAQDSQLGIVLGQQTDALKSYFERSRAINALLAANPVFTDFFRAPGTTKEKIDAGGPLLQRVNDALAHLESLYPDRIGEACFIDGSGQEIARVVDGTPAAPADLSQHEDHNPFFAPTLALGHGHVYQAQKYESPDTHDQVISNSTVVTAAGHTGLVHFEIAVDSFRMPESAEGITASIIDARSGHVIVDSRVSSATAGNGVMDHSLLPVTRLGQEHGIVTLGQRRIAFRQLPSDGGNANHWYVVISAPVFGQGWTGGLSIGSLGLLVAALLTILIAGTRWRTHLRAMRRLASYDPVTGLANRALLTECLGALRDGRPAAVLAINLERFDEVNDLLGHRYGDLLLKEVAARLDVQAPATATMARLDHDTFAVLMPGAGEAEARVTAGQLRTALHHTYLLDEAGLDLEVSIGVACGSTTDPDNLLRRANAAMHLAQQRHTGYEVHDPAGEDDAPHRLALLGDLRRAMDSDDQILLHYQPKIDLAGNRLAGVEALVRWQHPTLGRLAPDSFIPLAESTSLIHTLTTRVLDIAVRQAKAWQDEGLRIPVAVNLSTRCLLDPGLAKRIFDLLERTGLPASLLEIEITESMIMSDPDRALTTLSTLHDGGIQLAIDDFGTGHSTMAYLQRLPVDELKIDKSFIQQIEATNATSVLVRTTITLGHNLGLRVVAEGVENDDVVARLRDLGCDVAQGYHFARPMPAEEIQAWSVTFNERQTVPAP